MLRNSRCPSCWIIEEDFYGIRCEFSPDFTRRNAGMVFYSPYLDAAGTGGKSADPCRTAWNVEDFYAEKYLDTLRVGAGTESDELFDKSHGFYIAVIQGFFRDYYYTRGSAFSFLVEQKPEYVRYFTPWAQVTPTAFPNPAENQIIENYCSGVYLSPEQVAQLLRDMEQDSKVLEDLEGLWSNGQIAVLKKALSAAARLKTGLLEATEVVEPNPIRPNESTSYSNLYHCDRDGVYLYMDTVSRQLENAIRESEGQV